MWSEPQQGFSASLLYFPEINCVTFKIMIFKLVETYGIDVLLATNNRSGRVSLFQDKCWPKTLFLKMSSYRRSDLKTHNWPLKKESKETTVSEVRQFNLMVCTARRIRNNQTKSPKRAKSSERDERNEITETKSTCRRARNIRGLATTISYNKFNKICKRR